MSNYNREKLEKNNKKLIKIGVAVLSTVLSVGFEVLSKSITGKVEDFNKKK